MSVPEKTTKEMKQRSYCSRVLEPSWRGYAGRSKRGAGRESGRASGVQREGFGVPELRLDWTSQTKTCEILVSSREHTRGRPWEVEETVAHKACLGSHIRNLLCI